MFRKAVFLFLTGVAALVSQAVATQTASAHYVYVSATASCKNNVALIDYTVTSWNASAPGTNPKVEVYFNGVKVDTQAFTGTPNVFTGQKPAPSGSSATVMAVAAGTWGDGGAGGQSASTSVTIPTDCVPVTTGDGRFTGGGKQVLVGGAELVGAAATDAQGHNVTKGFELHCDLDHPNNLEVNWSGGHRFHTEVLTSAVCTDDPNIQQRPPKAPVDTIIGKGTGRYDGQSGYTIEFTLVDAGEPGTSDQSAFKIYETANPANIVLNVPLNFVIGGNIQAHFDNK